MFFLIVERDTVLIERSNLVNISKLVVKEVNKYHFKIIGMSLRMSKDMASTLSSSFSRTLSTHNIHNILSIHPLYPQVIESSLKFGRQLDSDHIPLQHFFIVLEHVLRHGIRPKKVNTQINNKLCIVTEMGKKSSLYFYVLIEILLY